jgi:glycosyltransferase involved in cell wall biosynthesis
MRFSIVVPTLNEAILLPNLLADLQSQTYTDFETIIADAGSQDGTRELALSAGVRLVPGGMPAVGRNRGAEAAQGEFLVFLDADTRVQPDFLEKASPSFCCSSSPASPAASAPRTPRPRLTLFPQTLPLLMPLRSAATCSPAKPTPPSPNGASRTSSAPPPAEPNPRGELFVFLPGTGALPSYYTQLMQTAAEAGLHVIDLRYPNDENVNIDICPRDPDENCHQLVR